MKIGLKLWSKNTDYYFEEAKKIYEQGIFQYIELYIVPNTLETVNKWKILQKDYNIPFTLHAPHFMHGVNLAKEEYEQTNIEIFKQVEIFSKELNAEYVVVHGGIEGTIEETIRQLKLINLNNILIENKPYIAPLKDGRICRGSTIEEIQKVIAIIRCGFCLDIGHAICTSNTLKLEPYRFLAQFNVLNPTCYHLSDNLIDSEIDRHMHLGKGNYDFKKIFGIINKERNIAIETNKNSKKNLVDFIGDIEWVKNLK